MQKNIQTKHNRSGYHGHPNKNNLRITNVKKNIMVYGSSLQKRTFLQGGNFDS